MIKKILLIFLLTYPQFSHSSVEVDFNIWLKKFKITAQKEGISNFLPQVLHVTWSSRRTR